MTNTTPTFNNLMSRCAHGVNVNMKMDDLKQLMSEVSDFVLDTSDDVPTDNIHFTVREQRKFMMNQYRDLSNQFVKKLQRKLKA
jgi:hypothetical protein